MDSYADTAPIPTIRSTWLTPEKPAFHSLCEPYLHLPSRFRLLRRAGLACTLDWQNHFI